MAPQTGTALLIIGAFVLPGFVTLLFRERTHVVEVDQTPFERTMRALFYSAVVYGVVLFAAWTIGGSSEDVSGVYRGHRTLGAYLGLGGLVLFVVPALIAMTSLKWQRSKRLRPVLHRSLGVSSSHSIRAGWDALFGSDHPTLLRATLADGRVVGGYFGCESLAGYAEQTRDLFLEERWELDDDSWFKRPAPASLGVWIAADSLVSLEVYKPPTAADPPSQ